MRMLVIGGTGFIGRFVVRDLLAQRHDVTVYHSRGSVPEITKVAKHVRNTTQGLPILRFPEELLETEFDCVVHMIAMGRPDSEAAVSAFRGVTKRIIVISSGDVYRAYGRLVRTEPGPLEPMPLTEDSTLRSLRYPYRARAASVDALEYWYEKIDVEDIFLGSGVPTTVLRLPKVYGRGSNQDLATVHRYRHHPSWRWTHGYVENVAAAIALSATHSVGGKTIYNVGEQPTPTVAERLRGLPPSDMPIDHRSDFEFAQDIVLSSRRIRRELGYQEPISSQEAIQRTIGPHLT